MHLVLSCLLLFVWNYDLKRDSASTTTTSVKVLGDIKIEIVTKIIPANLCCVSTVKDKIAAAKFNFLKINQRTKAI